MATPVAPVLFVYLYFTLSDAVCPDIFVRLFEDPASDAVFVSVVAAIVLSYAMVVVASPRRTRWRYALGVPVAVTAGIVVLLTAFLAIDALPDFGAATPAYPGRRCD